MRLGSVPAILISGVVWGVWHAPCCCWGTTTRTPRGR
ncbi:hypothetical protein [Arthrobacter sp. JCM 19049]